MCVSELSDLLLVSIFVVFVSGEQQLNHQHWSIPIKEAHQCPQSVGLPACQCVYVSFVKTVSVQKPGVYMCEGSLVQESPDFE